PTRPSCVRVRRSAPNERGGSSLGLEHLVSRRSLPGMLHPWARAGSRRFPGDPSYASALLQDPGRADKASPLAVLPTPPPAYPNRRPQRVLNLEANTGLQHLLSTLHERRRRHPCKTRFRLAGCASTGRASNPLDRCERFQVTFPSSLPGLALSQAESSPNCTRSRIEECRARIAKGPEGVLERFGRPNVVAIEGDVLPAERSDMGKQGIVDDFALRAQLINGAPEIKGVPEGDGRDGKIEPGSPVSLIFEGAVTDFAE